MVSILLLGSGVAMTGIGIVGCRHARCGTDRCPHQTCPAGLIAAVSPFLILTGLSCAGIGIVV